MNAKFYLFTWLVLSCCPSFAQRDFITVWDLSKPGSGEEQISFGASMRGVVNYSWKELSPGNATGSGTLSAEWITLFGMPAGAIIELSLSPQNLTMFYGNKDQQRLIDVKQWGDVRWSSMQISFANCVNLHISATDVPDLSRVKTMEAMFMRCTYLNGPENISDWDVSSVMDMRNVFHEAIYFNQPIGKWNVSNVTNMAGMLSKSYSFNQDISSWDVSRVTVMREMFAESSMFNQPIGNWNVSNVTDMHNMFFGSRGFNHSLDNWDVSQVTDMDGLFCLASSFDQSLANWAAKLNPNVRLGKMINSSGLSIKNYDAFLVALSEHGPSQRSLDAFDMKFCEAAEARAHLVKSVSEGGKGWVIRGDAQDCALPVTLVSFSGGSIQDNKNQLDWITADETDFDRFEIQRSQDARSFETIGIVKGGTSSTGVLGHYRFVDHHSEGMRYYRLKMVDTDRSFEYSKIISIQNNEPSGVVGEFYPNPARETTTIDIYAPDKSEWLISTTDISGRLLKTEKASLSPGINKIRLTIPKAGVKLVRFESGNLVEVRRLILSD